MFAAAAAEGVGSLGAPGERLRGGEESRGGG